VYAAEAKCKKELLPFTLIGMVTIFPGTQSLLGCAPNAEKLILKKKKLIAFKIYSPLLTALRLQGEKIRPRRRPEEQSKTLSAKLSTAPKSL
jgi:hypothetical protein